MNRVYLFVRSIKRSVWNLFDLPKDSKDFGFSFAWRSCWIKICNNFVYRVGGGNPARNERKHRLILGYLHSHFPEMVKEIRETPVHYEEEPVKKIWVFWWQGLQNAPEVVKHCRELLKRANEGEYEVIEVNKNNYSKYCTIPSHILNLLNTGRITVTQFSDMLRASLLFENGGIWIDSTVLTLKPADERITRQPFFTIHLDCPDDGTVAKFRISGFFLACKKGNTYMKLLRDMMFAYWQRQRRLIDYLLIDYCMILITKENKEYEDLLNAVPVTNQNVHTLREHINDQYNPTEWAAITKDTNFFKLTYKIKLSETTPDGKPTNYHHFLKEL